MRSLKWKKKCIRVILCNQGSIIKIISNPNKFKAIVTQVQLHDFEIVKYNFCKFCTKDPESLLLLFCKSEMLSLFWNNVSEWIS